MPIVATAITSFINLVKDSTLVIIDVKTLLGAGLHFLAIEPLELLDGTLIKRIAQVKHFKTLLPQGLQERRGGLIDGSLDVRDLVLVCNP